MSAAAAAGRSLVTPDVAIVGAGPSGLTAAELFGGDTASAGSSRLSRATSSDCTARKIFTATCRRTGNAG